MKARNHIFWGWYVVFGAFTILVINYGIRYSFGVFVKPMFAEYGWPMTVIQFGASVNLAVYAGASALAGWLLDRFAAKWIIMIGIVITSGGMLLASTVTTPIGLYLSYGVLVGGGSAGCGVVVSSVTVGKWFRRYRGLAIGLSSMGIGIGTLLMAPLAGYIVKYHGWRNGFLSIGLLVAVVGISVSQIFMGKKGPAQLGLQLDGAALETDPDPSRQPVQATARVSLKPALRDPQYWIMATCNLLAVVTVMMAFNLQIAYAIANGINELTAAAAVGVMGLTGSMGKLFFGWFSDRIRDAKYAASAGFMIMAAGMLLLYTAKTPFLLYAFAAVYGFGYGSLAPMIPYLISDRFGLEVLGSAYGFMILFVNGIGGSTGPIIGGYIYDRTGSYDPAWLGCLALLLIAAFAILTLKPRQPRV